VEVRILSWAPSFEKVKEGPNPRGFGPFLLRGKRAGGHGWQLASARPVVTFSTQPSGGGDPMDDNKLNKGLLENEGEGSKTADKSYREGATSFAKKGDMLKKGLDAERDVEMYKDDFDSAEKAGRSHSAGDLPNDLSGNFGNKK
jgi:hypothetical protein